MTDRFPTPPKNLMEFAHRFATDELCAEYLFERRHPDGDGCPTCGSVKAWSVAEKPGMMICDRGHKISVTAGTAMHRTTLPLHRWFDAAWRLATLKPGLSALQWQRQRGNSRLETAWTLLHKRRAAMYAPGRERLSSFCLKNDHADHWVEVDEVYVGGEEEGTEHRGRGAETTSLVVVAVEVHTWLGDAEEQDDARSVAKKRKERQGSRRFIPRRARSGSRSSRTPEASRSTSSSTRTSWRGQPSGPTAISATRSQRPSIPGASPSPEPATIRCPRSAGSRRT